MVRDKGSQSDPSRSWTLYVDGSSTMEMSGEGVILINPEGFKIQQAIKFSFSATNNEAEYKAIIAGLKLAVELETKIIDIYSDSQLVVKQVTRDSKVHNEKMGYYLQRT